MARGSCWAVLGADKLGTATNSGTPTDCWEFTLGIGPQSRHLKAWSSALRGRLRDSCHTFGGTQALG